MIPKRFTAAAFVVGASMFVPGCATYDDFSLTTADGATMALSGQKGKAVLVTFWAVG